MCVCVGGGGGGMDAWSILPFVKRHCDKTPKWKIRNTLTATMSMYMFHLLLPAASRQGTLQDTTPHNGQAVCLVFTYKTRLRLCHRHVRVTHLGSTRSTSIFLKSLDGEMVSRMLPVRGHAVTWLCCEMCQTGRVPNYVHCTALICRT